MQAGELLQIINNRIYCPCPESIGPAGPDGPVGYSITMGRILRVDQVFGNDAISGGDIYIKPFKTINGAITAINGPPFLNNHTIWIFSGGYDESIIIPANTSIRGMNTQTVLIRRLAVTTSTTVVTMGVNSRIEDVTIQLTSSVATGTPLLIGIDYPTGTSTISKLRTAVVSVTYTGEGGAEVYGVRSAGTSPTIISSSNAIRAVTINAISNSDSKTRGIFISGPNRFAIRDTNVFASGAGNNIVGCEVTDASGVLELRTSTISGISTTDFVTSFDIARTTGNIVLDFTDLVNHNSNTGGFSVSVFPAFISFNTFGDLAATTNYNLVPGTVSLANLPTSIYEFGFIDKSIVFSTVIRYSGTIPVGVSLTFAILKNGIPTAVVLVMTSTSGGNVVLDTRSASFATTDLISARLSTNGDPGPGTFTSICYLY